jgi:hypothetical protein
MARFPRIERFIDPGEALGEVMFGLIMVLTFTAGARIITSRTELDTHELITAAVGCNLAWGVIDAVLFVFGSLLYRSQRAHFFRTLRTLASETEAMAAIQQEFGLEDQPLAIRPEDRQRLYESILELAVNAAPARIRVTRADVVAAVAVFLLVSASALPGVIPFLLVDDTYLALRLSNLVLVLLLFGAGAWWAHYSDIDPLRGGLTVMLLGVMMVGVSVVLGG